VRRVTCAAARSAAARVSASSRRSDDISTRSCGTEGSTVATEEGAAAAVVVRGAWGSATRPAVDACTTSPPTRVYKSIAELTYPRSSPA
jgi:hypothetical protein